MVKAGVLKPEYLDLVQWPEMTRMLHENGHQYPPWWPVDPQQGN